MHFTKMTLFTFMMFIILLFLISNLFPKRREGFNPNDIINDIKGVTNVINDVKRNIMSIDDKFAGLTSTIRTEAESIARSVVGEIEEGINTAISEVEDKATEGIQGVTSVVNEVEKKATEGINGVTDLVKQVEKKAMAGIRAVTSIVEKIKNVIINFGYIFVDIMEDAIVTPFKKLFFGLGNVFQQIFGIFKELGDKILELYGCVLFYMSDGIYKTIVSVSKAILPSFITDIIGTIYDYTLGIILKWVLGFFGYYEEREKCYDFNINKQIKNIREEFNEIGKAFRDGFGKFDFSKLNIKF